MHLSVSRISGLCENSTAPQSALLMLPSSHPAKLQSVPSPRAHTRGRVTGGQTRFLVNSRTRVHSPPPRMRVASCHCRTYFRHLPTPSGVMLKEHMGSPAMVSAPSCSTTASGLNAAYTSFSTLWKGEAVRVTANVAQKDAGGMALVPQTHRCLSRFLHFCAPTTLIPVTLPRLPVSLLPPLLSCSKFNSQSAHRQADEGKSITENTGKGDLVLISLVVASNYTFTLAALSGRAASQIRGFSPL